MLKNIVLLIVVVTLCGCAAPPAKYVLPEGIPFANLKSTLSSGFGMNESAAVFLVSDNSIDPKHRTLFSIKDGKSDPSDYIRVPADIPLHINYYESIAGGRYCKIDIQVKFEEGNKYYLTGGMDYKKGPIPILTGVRGCKLGVVDEATNLSVPISKSK